ncbi:MAG: bifunctional UDP-N-acetylglucosamine diphosphorylase/glucosamine-1-phosphate N-acetyltransferase GlmU [Proteobacteria bacterium]|nr:bifunctional UDP-N-acetylglucosamine diphosphorylase/glucosamine-1-phosphate N-acetyltransferase GlmU [Pseudomonadota bacterium]
MNKLQIVILAAGQGTRMKSDLPKILHLLGGRPVLHYVLDLAHQMKPQEIVLVVGPALQDIQTSFRHKTIVQYPAQGTGDAVKQASPHIKAEGYILILFGDTPLIQKHTLERMMDLVQDRSDMALVLLGMRPEDKQNYARLLLNESGELEEVIEDKDLNSSERTISLCNSGVMLVKGDLLNSLLSALTPNNAAHEYYLTDLVKIARQKGYACGYVEGDAAEFIGINTRQDLAAAEAFLQKRWREQAMTEGVTLLDPPTTYFSYDTKISHDVRIHPCVTLGPGVEISKGAEILSFCQLSETYVGSYAVVGPFAHLRGGVHLNEKVEIGNFVEVKKSTFGSSSKAKHLSYIGDSNIGSQTNIGAGTITCNYDGFNKFNTRIGDGVFIGSNSSLVAPLSIGDYAIIGAGSVVTKDVESHALAFARSNQSTLKDGADRFRKKREKEKDS